MFITADNSIKTPPECPIHTEASRGYGLHQPSPGKKYAQRTVQLLYRLFMDKTLGKKMQQNNFKGRNGWGEKVINGS
jgi:hypothetical protein